MKKIINWLFYAPKHEKPTDQNIMSLIMPAILGICVCMVCLVGLTVAWYRISVTTGVHTIAASTFDASATVVTGDVRTNILAAADTAGDEENEPVQETGVEVKGENNVYKLDPGIYTITVNNVGTGRGYVEVSTSKSKLYTVVIEAPEQGMSSKQFRFAIEVEGNEAQEVTVSMHWGTHSETADVVKNNGKLICDENSNLAPAK